MNLVNLYEHPYQPKAKQSARRRWRPETLTKPWPSIFAPAMLLSSKKTDSQRRDRHRAPACYKSKTLKEIEVGFELPLWPSQRKGRYRTRKVPYCSSFYSVRTLSNKIWHNDDLNFFERPTEFHPKKEHRPCYTLGSIDFLIRLSVPPPLLLLYNRHQPSPGDGGAPFITRLLEWP